MTLHNYKLFRVAFKNEIVVAVEKEETDYCEIFIKALKTHFKDIVEWNTPQITEYAVVKSEHELPEGWGPHVSPYTQHEDYLLSAELQGATIVDFFECAENFEKRLKEKDQQNAELSERVAKLEKQLQALLKLV